MVAIFILVVDLVVDDHADDAPPVDLVILDASCVKNATQERSRQHVYIEKISSTKIGK